MEIRQVLKMYWGYDSFRPLQEEIIRSVMEGKDTLALMPTGGGKSICFQVPALVKEGICIVISPLIALMKDQVEQLRKRNISAVAIYSGMNSKEIDIVLDNCIYGNVKFLYVSPERLKTNIFQERAKKMKVNLIAVDEAHCISQWGYNFRPSYLQIADLREILPGISIIALTASATKEVKEDIQQKLLFKDSLVFEKSFARANLSYSVFRIENKELKLLEILKKVTGTAIVYVRSRKQTKEISDYLTRHKISATHYHAGLNHKERSARQDDWIKGRTRVIVATNAFGMGIDKPDVRVVVHLNLNNNLESYYQEAGRAGRDEKKAYAVMVYHAGDIDELRAWVGQAYPSLDFIKKVYQSLANFFKIALGSSMMASYDFELEYFVRTFNLPSLETFHALKKLQEEGFIDLNESFFKPSRVMIIMNQQDLYKYQIANATHDPVIKAMLRLYGGEMFVEFLSISEHQISKFLEGASVEEVEDVLNALHKLEVIIYDKKKDKPQLTFLTPRYDADALPLDKRKLEKRQEIDEHKAEAVISYVSHTKRCRSLLIQEYFGEISYSTCGICDICLEQKKDRDNEDLKLKAGLKIIKNTLGSQPMTIEDLIKNIQPKDKNKFIATVRLLVDNQDLVYDEYGRIKVKK